MIRRRARARGRGPRQRGDHRHESRPRTHPRGPGSRAARRPSLRRGRAQSRDLRTASIAFSSIVVDPACLRRRSRRCAGSSTTDRDSESGLRTCGFAQLEQAVDVLPLRSVQVEVSPFADSAVRGASFARVSIAASSARVPTVRGAKKARTLLRDPVSRRDRGRASASPSRRSCCRGSRASASFRFRARRDRDRNCVRRARRDSRRRPRGARRTVPVVARAAHAVARDGGPRGGTSEVVLLMGSPAAGKTTMALARTGVRLNRDERGGTLRGHCRRDDRGDRRRRGARRARQHVPDARAAERR
jgi:hypothetical protein